MGSMREVLGKYAKYGVLRKCKLAIPLEDGKRRTYNQGGVLGFWGAGVQRLPHKPFTNV